MILPPFLYGLLVFLIFAGIIFITFFYGRKIKYKVLKYFLYCLGGVSIALLWLIGISVTDDVNTSDISPTLIIINDDGTRTERKIIGYEYKGCKISFKRGGSYYVENRTKDEIVAIKVFFHFYGEKSQSTDAPTIVAIIPPNQVKEIPSNKPVGLVEDIPYRRYFKTRGHHNQGRGRSVTYLLKR